jgi:hypothetical protein
VIKRKTKARSRKSAPVPLVAVPFIEDPETDEIVAAAIKPPLAHPKARESWLGNLVTRIFG